MPRNALGRECKPCNGKKLRPGHPEINTKVLFQWSINIISLRSKNKDTLTKA